MKMHHRIAMRRTLAVAACVLAKSAMTQEAVMSVPASKLTAPVLREAGPQSQSRPSEPTGAFFQFGSVSLHPHLLARYLNGLNLPVEGGRKVDSTIASFAPGLQVDAGRHWTLDYTPVWTSYSARALSDTVEHIARLQGAGQIQEWEVQVSENYAASSRILFETGRQTKQTTAGTQMAVARSFLSKFAFQATASLNDRHSESSPDIREWVMMNWLVARFSPRLETGLGLGGGYSDIVSEPDSTTKRFMGRFNWSPADKVKFSIEGGLELLRSRAASSSELRNPIVTASMAYQPFTVTTIIASGGRTVVNSLFQNQVTEGSNLSFGLQQRLLGRLFLSATYGKQESNFRALAAGSATTATPGGGPALASLPGRSDQTDSLNGRLTTQLLKRWTVAASYQRNANRSSQAGFEVTTTQFGLEVGCKY